MDQMLLGLLDVSRHSSGTVRYACRHTCTFRNHRVAVRMGLLNEHAQQHFEYSVAVMIRNMTTYHIVACGGCLDGVHSKKKSSTV